MPCGKRVAWFLKKMGEAMDHVFKRSNSIGLCRVATMESNARACSLLLLLLLVLFGSGKGDDTSPFWAQTLPSTLFTSVGVIASPSLMLQEELAVRFAAATWDRDPMLAEVFSPSSINATAAWTYRPDSSITPSSLAVATARHIDMKSTGPVDLVVATYFEDQQGHGRSACNIVGFKSGDSAAKPIWQYNVTGSCSVDLSLEGDSKAALKMSDDGSTVVFAVSVLDDASGTAVPQLHCIDGQTGKLQFVYQPKNEKPGSNSVSLSRGGDHIAYSNGLTIYVVEKSTGQLRTKPLVRQMYSDVHICPMGMFLLYAINLGSVVRRWNAATEQYEVTPFQPKTPAGEPNSWIAVSHSTSVNGEDHNPAGCIAAVGWLGMGPNQGVAKLEVFSMLTGQVFVEWTSTKGAGYQNFPVMAMHLGYTALATWGNDNLADEPNIMLFHTDFGNTTVMEYTAKGSVMAIDMVYTPYALPPVQADDQIGHNRSTLADVYLVAAAKLEHASVPGIGGQCLAFKIPVAARPRPRL
eukprot:Stramenopile-MAST_4_protein_1715